MLNPEDLRAAYDSHLRIDLPGAAAVTRQGPLVLAEYVGGRGYITYPHLVENDSATVRRWVSEALAHFRENPAITSVEWKTRAHDRLAGLDQALRASGFEAGEPESIMIGQTRDLIVDVDLPPSVRLRRIDTDADVRAMSAMADEIFGDPASERTADALISRLARKDGMELWVAEADGEMVSCGRMEPVENSPFAGLWGGSTRPEWRGRGIYRALTATRARSALRAQKTLMNSDSTEDSRPILERSGFRRVSTTTPYEWRRAT